MFHVCSQENDDWQIFLFYLALACLHHTLRMRVKDTAIITYRFGKGGWEDYRGIANCLLWEKGRIALSFLVINEVCEKLC